MKSASGIQIEKMICAANGFVGDALLVKEFAKFSVDAGIVALPKSAKTDLRRVPRSLPGHWVAWEAAQPVVRRNRRTS